MLSDANVQSYYDYIGDEFEEAAQSFAGGIGSIELMAALGFSMRLSNVSCKVMLADSQNYVCLANFCLTGYIHKSNVIQGFCLCLKCQAESTPA
jgi:hypothetical protein